MKVGVIFADRPASLGGGYTYETEVLFALQALADESQHHFVIFSNTYSSEADTNNISYLPYPQSKWFQKIIPSLKLKLQLSRIYFNSETRLDKLAKENGVEVLWHIGANSIYSDLPYIANVWDVQHRVQPWFPEVSSGGQWDIRDSFYTWYLQRAIYVITGNEAGKNELQRYFNIDAHKIRLLPHMTPSFALEEWNDLPDCRSKYGISRKYIFYPAQYWAHKNHVNLLYAVKTLEEKYNIIVDVVFVGSDHGNEEHIKQVITDLKLQGNVHLLGFIPREDLIWFYKNAFAMTYVSYFGPENLPPMEAFGLGCPVIASNVDGAKEQFFDAAMLVEPSDPDCIASAINDLYQDDEKRQYLIDKGKDVAKKWTSEDFVRKVFELLDEFEPIRRCWSL